MNRLYQFIIQIPFQFVEREAQTICYLTNWSHKRPGMGKFMPENIDTTLCTHIIYAFATLKNHLLSEGSDKDIEMYQRLIELREKNPDIKAICNILIYNKLTCNSQSFIIANDLIEELSTLSDSPGNRWLGFRFHSI